MAASSCALGSWSVAFRAQQADVGVSKGNEVRLLIVAILWECWAGPVTGVCLEERQAGNSRVALPSSRPCFQLLRRSFFASPFLFPEHPSSPSRQALSRQHLCLNDFNELYQFLGVSSAVLSIFAVVIFWSSVEYQLLNIPVWIFFILY